MLSSHWLTPGVSAAAAILGFFAVLAWIAIIGAKLQRLQRELGELVEKARARD